MAGLTKLQAVNELLEATNILPATALDTGSRNNVGLAEDLLDRVTSDVMTRGWHANTEGSEAFPIELEFPTRESTGTVASGTFVAGETVTQATSGATAQFHQIVGATVMTLSNITGTFTNGDDIIGDDSAANWTSSAVATVASGEIVLAADVLRVDSAGSSRHRDVALRNGKLYDRREDTQTFTENIFSIMVRLQDFANTTPALRRLITATAKRDWQRRKVDDPRADAGLREELVAAQLLAGKHETETADINILHTGVSRMIRGGPFTQHPTR